MADNKKYYYLKLKDNFYDSEEMIILQNMQDGYLYSDILLKLYLRSLKTNGKLMFKDVIPYTPQVLAQVVRHQVGTVEKALDIFQKLGLVEILDNGTIYMLDIQNFIGKSSTEADRIRNYRQKIKSEEIGCTNVQLLNDKSTPEIEIDIELEKEKDAESISKIVKCYEENIGMLQPATAEIIFSYLDDLTAEMIIEAIKVAVRRGTTTAYYIEGILKDWVRKNYKTLADIQKERNKKCKKEEEKLEIEKVTNDWDDLYDN